MRIPVASLLILTLSLAAAPGHALRTYGMSVREDPTMNGGVAVFQRAGRTAVDYWCAAGDYAHRKLRASNNQTLTIVRPAGADGGPGPGASIGFQLAGQPRNGGPLVGIDRAGETRSIGQARLLCTSSRSHRIDNRE